MDKELNEFGEPYPTLSEMEAKYAELYKGTFSYQAEALRKSLVVLGEEIVAVFSRSLIDAVDFIVDFLSVVIVAPIIEWLDTPLSDAIEPECVDVLVRNDGEILVIEDAPPVEFLGKRKNG